MLSPFLLVLVAQFPSLGVGSTPWPLSVLVLLEAAIGHVLSCIAAAVGDAVCHELVCGCSSMCCTWEATLLLARCHILGVSVR